MDRAIATPYIGLTDTALRADPSAEEAIASYDFGFRSIPTTVELLSFAAVWQGSSVVVHWETASEVDNLGFSLYRAESPAHKPDSPLNGGLIPSHAPPGSGLGASFSFLDYSVPPGRTYQYWLESVDVQGGKTRYAPAAIRVYKAYLPVIVRNH
jgi:hypothetical protein